MARGAKTAVVADISPEQAGRTARMLEKAGYSVAIVRDGAEAFRQCLADAPRALVADAVLPVMDGAGLAKRVREARIPFRPGIVLAALPGFARPFSAPGVCLLAKPFSEEALLGALAKTAVEMRVPDAQLRGHITRMLDRLGVPEHPGREYLIDAAFLACEDQTLISALTAELYPMVARRSGVKPEAVERAMRHAIETAWSRGSIDAQYEIFKGTIDAARGKPTCGGMIAQLSELMRMEG